MAVRGEGAETAEEASVRAAHFADWEESPEGEPEPHWADQDVVRDIAAAWCLDPITFDASPDAVADGWIAEGLADR